VPTTESSGRVPGDPGIEGDSAGKRYRRVSGGRTEALVEVLVSRREDVHAGVQAG
jgi:hypothetical protein